MSATGVIGLALGLALGASVLLLVAALRGWRPPARTSSKADRRRDSLLLGPGLGKRSATALGVALAVLVATRWPVAAGAGAGLVLLWPTIFGAGRDAAGQVERLESLATWTESLRDSIAGSIGLEEAIRHSLGTAPPVLRPALERLAGRLRVQIPMPRALAAFAEEFEDSSADLVIAALILNARLRGPGLVATLSALATAAREEIDMRRRIEEGRKALWRTAAVIVGATGLFAGGLAVFSRDYVAPYSTPVGQVVLALVLSVFAGGLVWIRAAADLQAPPRFLVGVDELDAALAPRGEDASSAASEPSFTRPTGGPR